jgi:hypothetical protein
VNQESIDYLVELACKRGSDSERGRYVGDVGGRHLFDRFAAACRTKRALHAPFARLGAVALESIDGKQVE